MNEKEVIHEIKNLYKVKTEIYKLIEHYESRMFLKDHEKATLRMLKHLQSIYEKR